MNMSLEYLHHQTAQERLRKERVARGVALSSKRFHENTKYIPPIVDMSKEYAKVKKSKTSIIREVINATNTRTKDI